MKPEEAKRIVESFLSACKASKEQKNCFTCYTGNPNWIAVLQDILEDEKVDLSTICDQDYFTVLRGRLRVREGQCISSRTIERLLKDAQ